MEQDGMHGQRQPVGVEVDEGEDAGTDVHISRVGGARSNLTYGEEGRREGEERFG